MARRLGAAVVNPYPREQLLEEAAAWSGGVLQRAERGSLPMAHPGGIDVVYDTVGTGHTAEVGVRLLKSRGTMVKSGVNAPERWEWSPLYFKEISWVGSNAFGVEEVDGERLHGIAHYLRHASSLFKLRPVERHLGGPDVVRVEAGIDRPQRIGADAKSFST